jgi:uncharacterized membrane protein
MICLQFIVTKIIRDTSIINIRITIIRLTLNFICNLYFMIEKNIQFIKRIRKIVYLNCLSFKLLFLYILFNILSIKIKL